MIKVLVVDDSALIRKILSDILNKDPEIEVVGIAQNGKIALNKIETLNPDVITMDIVMPEMDGLETLKYIMTHNPKPVIMVSSLAKKDAEKTFTALNFGAIDFITKPESVFSSKITEKETEIISKVKAAFTSKIEKTDIKATEEEEEFLEKKRKEKKKSNIIGKNFSLSKIVAIGVSTGGPQALKKVLPLFPKDIDFGILIVQHMPETFTNAFAERMNTLSRVIVEEASNGSEIKPGKVIIAKGNYHLELIKERNTLKAMLNQKPRVSMFRPSIDVMMMSTLSFFGNNTIGVIMTGMGFDGVEGIGAIKKAGGVTIAQDRESSVVFGMNGLAVKKGFINKVVPLSRLSREIMAIANCS